MQPWPTDFRQNATTAEILGIFFLLSLLGKVLFPWWSSPQPHILSKVMQLRLLLHGKCSFCFPATTSSAHTLVQQQLLLFAQPFPGPDRRWMFENYSLQEQLFSTAFGWTPLTPAGEKVHLSGSALSLNNLHCDSAWDISYIWYIFLLEIKNPPSREW